MKELSPLGTQKGVGLPGVCTGLLECEKVYAGLCPLIAAVSSPH